MSRRAVRSQQHASRSRASETRPQIEEDLEARQPRALLAERANLTIGHRAWARNRNHERRTVELIAQVNANRAYRRLVPETQTHGMREVIELVGAVGYANR